MAERIRIPGRPGRPRGRASKAENAERRERKREYEERVRKLLGPGASLSIRIAPFPERK